MNLSMDFVHKTLHEWFLHFVIIKDLNSSNTSSVGGGSALYTVASDSLKTDYVPSGSHFNIITDQSMHSISKKTY